MIYITGSMGFIGTHTAVALKAAGYDILGFDKKVGSDLVDFDMLTRMAEQRPPDMIVHIAGSCSTQKGIDNPRQDFSDNLMATFNVCDLARVYKCPVIYMSTCKVYPHNEEKLRTPYGVSKYAGELYLKEFAKLYGFEYIINRPGTIYGPGQEGSPESGWIAWFLQSFVKNSKIVVNGDGNQTRDILYIEDMVKLLVDQVIEFGKYKNATYDIGGGASNEVSLIEVLQHLGYDNYIHGPERAGDVKRFVSDNAKVSAVNGWKPEVDWMSGLNKTADYYKILFQKMN